MLIKDIEKKELNINYIIGVWLLVFFSFIILIIFSFQVIKLSMETTKIINENKTILEKTILIKKLQTKERNRYEKYKGFEYNEQSRKEKVKNLQKYFDNEMNKIYRATGIRPFKVIIRKISDGRYVNTLLFTFDILNVNMLFSNKTGKILVFEKIQEIFENNNIIVSTVKSIRRTNKENRYNIELEIKPNKRNK